MITRRGFMIAGGGALGALAISGGASAATMHAADKLTIASLSRKLAPAQQGTKHLVLSGNRIKDLSTLEQVFTAARAAEIELHIDTADRVLLDIALSRVAHGYQQVTATSASFGYRRTSVFGA